MENGIAALDKHSLFQAVIAPTDSLSPPPPPSPPPYSWLHTFPFLVTAGRDSLKRQQSLFSRSPSALDSPSPY